MTFRVVLDTGAVLAYAAGSVNVGALIVELVDEQAQFLIPNLVLLEAAAELTPPPAERLRRATPDGLRLLDVLVSHRSGRVSSFGADDWRETAPAIALFGSAGRAVAAVAAAYGVARYVVTTDPGPYRREGLDAITVV
ncbi:hypothetical protein [Dactylosporangium sp. CS-033363]|uniref:hypothetical protein n=1 Tax=Dactylosporangium sp. CS-033363 TaxID=3239935 RepID=UPI003D9020DE